MAKKTMSFSEHLQATLDRHNRGVAKNAELMAQARARVFAERQKGSTSRCGSSLRSVWEEAMKPVNFPHFRKKDIRRFKCEPKPRCECGRTAVMICDGKNICQCCADRKREERAESVEQRVHADLSCDHRPFVLCLNPECPNLSWDSSAS